MITLPPPLFRMKALSPAAPPKRKYGCLMAMLPSDITKEIRDWAKMNIDPSHLAEEGLGDEIHVTVKYGFKDDGIVDKISQLCREFGRFPIRLESVSQFKGNEDGDVLKVDVEGSLLRRLNRLVSSMFDNYDKYPTYKPHLTLAYLKPAFSHLYDDTHPSFLGKEVWVERLKYSTAARQKTLIHIPELIQIKSAPTTRRSPGQVWRGASGRWFTMTPERRVVPTKAPGGNGNPAKESDEFEFLDVSSEISKAKQTVVAAVVKLAGDVTEGTERIWTKLRVAVMKVTNPKTRKRLKAVARIAAAVEHQLDRFSSGTQGMVEKVTEQRNLSPKTKDRVVKWTKRMDFALKWTANIPVASHVIHAAEVATGPAGFVLAKMGYYLPVASLSYLAYSTARDPMATLRAAGSLLGKAKQHKSLEDGSIDAEFVNELIGLYQKYDEDLVDSLLAVAIDETHDAGKALDWVKRTRERQRTDRKALSWLSPTSGGALVKPAKQAKLPPSLFKHFMMTKATPKAQQQIGVPFQGASGRWFVRRQSDGRTVPYKKTSDEGNPANKPKKQAADKPIVKPNQVKVKPSVDQIKAGIGEFVAKGKVEHESAKVIADAISTLTVVQINELKKQLGLRGSGTKAQLAGKLANQILMKVKPTSPTKDSSTQDSPESKPAVKERSTEDVKKGWPKDSVTRQSDPQTEHDLAKLTEEQVIPNLDAEGQFLLRGYTGPGFERINGTARGTITDATEADRYMVLELDKIIRQSPKLPPTMTYRGLSVSGEAKQKLMNQLSQALKNGDSITLKGFSSTSLDPGKATEFAGKDSKEPLVFEIRASRGLYVEPITRETDEKELILPNNGKFRVVGMATSPTKVGNKISNVKYVQLEQVWEGE